MSSHPVSTWRALACVSMMLVIFWSLPLSVSGGHGHAHGGHGHAHEAHGHAHEREANPAHKWSRAANEQPAGRGDPTLEEEGIDFDDIEEIVGHADAHVHGGHGHAHHDHGHAHGGHGHAHGPPQKEHSPEEREKVRKKLHANWDDDDEEIAGRSKSSIWMNAIGSTLLISAAPFFILFLVPLDNSKEKEGLLKILLSFASGGLLGDAFLHLIPHALMAQGGEEEGGHGHSHGHGHAHGGEGEAHAPHDMSVGLGVLCGIISFLCVEKFVRIMQGGHGHSHAQVKPVEQKKVEETKTKKKAKKAKSSDDEKSQDEGEKSQDEGDKSKDEGKVVKKEEEVVSEVVGEVKVAGYLNLAADAFHNFTDGLAIGASFLAGEQIGIITTLTILLHEIPHEIGDFAILIQSGVPRQKAIMLQLLTAVGAMAGTLLSLFLEGACESASTLVLPFTAGGFIYIATVSVIPELLEGSSLKQSILEVIAMLLGILMMVIIAQYE